VYRRRWIQTSSANHASSPLPVPSSSSNSPMASKHARTMISTQPGTFLTMLGFASDKVSMNSNADSRRVCFWSSSSLMSRSSCRCGEGEGAGDPDGGEGGDEVSEEDGGNANAPCREPLLPGNGLPTVGVGPQSTGGSISAGRKVKSAGRWGAKRVGWVVHRGVRAEKKADR
jgi:hypothetical protein